MAEEISTNNQRVRRRPARARIQVIALLSMILLTFPATAAGRRKVIIDQDAFGPGGSDLQAILLVLQSPDVEVLGVTLESVVTDGGTRMSRTHAPRRKLV